MAKNDYFVIVYRILTYLYQCFMAGGKPDLEMFGPDALGINNGYWTNVDRARVMTEKAAPLQGTA